jgi:predicted TIM-barrel fold metal-dependent hydrolase
MPTSLPADSCDCHSHVFGPYARFPLAAERGYTPPEAPLDAYLAMLERAGLARGILVHPSAYGLNHDAITAALRAHRERLRGVAVVDTTTTDATLTRLHEDGVRAARFTESSSVAGKRFVGSVGLDQLPLLAPRLRAIGWHAEIWAPAARLAQDLPQLLQLGLPLVIDHLGSIDVSRGPDDPGFQALLRGLDSDRLWVKLCVQRASRQFPDYGDIRPFVDTLVTARPDRLLWGSDWPFLNMAAQTPTPEHLLALLRHWLPNESTRQLILVQNPAIRYGYS